MNGSAPLIAGGRGRRAEDIEVRAPRRIPANLVTKTALALMGHSRGRAPADLSDLGFSQVEFYEQAGATWVILHKDDKSETPGFDKDTGNIATVLIHLTEYPDLAVFDTPRGRIGATRVVAPASLDDENSKASKVLQGASALGKVAAALPHMPLAGGVIAGALPNLVEAARRLHGTSTDYSIRIAKLGVQLTARQVYFIRTGRGDREFEPPRKTASYTHARRRQYVIDMLRTVSRDIDDAWAAFAATPECTALSRGGQMLTRWLIETKWESLCRRSLDGFDNGLTWPLALRLLGLDDGAAQFVRRVATGREP